MTKKEQENIKTWKLYTLSVRVQDWLSQQGHNTGNGSNDTTHSTNVGTDPHQTLTPNTRSIPTAMYDDAAPMGYLKAIARLLKQAFFHKKGEHFILIRYLSIPTGLA